MTNNDHEEYKVYFLDSKQGSELIRAPGNLEKHDILLVEARTQCKHCNEYARPGESCCVCGNIPEGLTEEVEEQVREEIFGNFESSSHRLVHSGNTVAAEVKMMAHLNPQ